MEPPLSGSGRRAVKSVLAHAKSVTLKPRCSGVVRVREYPATEASPSGSRVNPALVGRRSLIVCRRVEHAGAMVDKSR